MVQEPQGNRQAVADRVRESVRNVEAQASNLRAQYTRLIVTGAVCSAGTTLVAGVTAARGPLIGEGPQGWRLACIVAAILGFIATLCITLSQQLSIPERLSEANQSLGRLKFLEVAITTGSRDWNEVMQEYQDIIRTYPDALR